jgi:hypothetical protein
MNRIKNKLFLLIGVLLVLHFDISSQTTQTYTASGLNTWTVPNCVTSVTVEVWGAGGGGGGGDIDTYSGSGGGGGGYSKSTISVVAGTVCQLYVGAGGAGGKNSNGKDGEDSWFINKTTILAKGGGGGKSGNLIVIGKGGTKGVGTITFFGGDGGKAYIPVELNTSGGGGGSSAGLFSNGNNGTDGANGLVNAPGGNAPLGGGAGGSGCGKGGAPIPDCGGFPGDAPGGGGGGGNDDIVLGKGGNGAPGQIKLTWKTGDSWFSNKTLSICSSNTFTIAPVSGIDGDKFPSGTTYSWELPIVTGNITGAKAQTSQTFISQTLINPSKTVQTATYLIKTSTDCNFTLTVTVYPQSQLISSLTPQAICSGTLFHYEPKGTAENLSYTWKRLAAAGINQPGKIGIENINETLTNSTDSPINVTYIYTTTSNGCNGMEQNVVLTILPLPQLSSELHLPAMCSGTMFNYIPKGTISGSTFTWKRAAINGMEQAGSSGAGNINEILTNTTALPINVTHVYTTSANGCEGKPQNVTVTVNPIPQLISGVNSHIICSGSPFTYSPASEIPGCVFTWNRLSINEIKEATANGAGNINETLTNTSNSPIAVTYTYTVTANGCVGKTHNVSVTVNPLPKLNSTLTPNAICSGTTFTYTPSGTIQGSLFTWKRATVEGINPSGKAGAGTIAESLTNTASLPINVIYNYNSTANGCKGIEQSVVVTVNSSAQLSSVLNPPAICSGSTFTYTPSGTIQGSLFTWKRAAIYGIEQAASSGTGNINETLTNTNVSPINVMYLYTTSVHSCEGKIQNVIVTVNPTPQLNSLPTTIAVCSGTLFSFNAENNKAGITYEWKRPNINGILEASSIGVGNINEILTNTTTSSINVTYVYTPMAKGCRGNEQNVMVTVNPAPQLTSLLNPPAICSGTILSYTPTSTIAGSAFMWSRAAINGISQAGSTGVGNIKETLINTASSTINISYAYKAKANGCEGKPQHVIVTINPIPQLNSILNPAAICSGTMFFYTPTSKTEGATFAWSRSTIAGIIQEGNKGMDKINESLTNSTISPLNVMYVYNATANGCKGSDQNVVVTINPLPQLNSMLSPPAICSGKAFNYLPASTFANATYTWVRSATNGIEQVGSSGLGNINEVITNEKASPIDVTYNYTTTANGCKGKEQSVIVKVNPLPKLNSTLTPSAICSGTVFKYNATSITPDVHFSWKRINITGTPLASSSGTGNISEILTNATIAPLTFTYVYTTSANNCDYNQNVLVTVNPLPTATIAGSCTKCLNDVAPNILFTGNSSKPPYKFTYKINGGKNLLITSDATGTALVPASTNLTGDFIYSLLSVSDSSSGLSCSQTQTGNAIVKVVQLEAELLGTTEVPVRATKPIITFKAIGGKAPYTFTYNLNESENLTKTTLGSSTSATILAPTNVPGDFVYTVVNIKDATGQSCVSEATATITVKAPNQNSKSKNSSNGSSKVKTVTVAPKRLMKLNSRYKLGK